MSLEHSPARETRAVRASGIAPVLISDVEAAKMLGCSRSTVWRWVGDGKLPRPIRIGGMTRFVLAEIEAVVQRAMSDRREVA